MVTKVLKKLKVSNKTIKKLLQCKTVLNRLINLYTVFSCLEFVIALIFKVKTISSINLIVLFYKIIDRLLTSFIF